MNKTDLQENLKLLENKVDELRYERTLVDNYEPVKEILRHYSYEDVCCLLIACFETILDLREENINLECEMKEIAEKDLL